MVRQKPLQSSQGQASQAGTGREGPLWHDEEFEQHQWSAEWGTVLAAVMADGEKFRRTAEAQICWTLLIRVWTKAGGREAEDRGLHSKDSSEVEVTGVNGQSNMRSKWKGGEKGESGAYCGRLAGWWWHWGTGLQGEVMGPGWGALSLRDQSIHIRRLEAAACAELRWGVFHRMLSGKLLLKVSLLVHVYTLTSVLKLWKWVKSSGKGIEGMKKGGGTFSPYFQCLGCTQFLLIQMPFY